MIFEDIIMGLPHISIHYLWLVVEKAAKSTEIIFNFYKNFNLILLILYTLENISSPEDCFNSNKLL